MVVASSQTHIPPSQRSLRRRLIAVTLVLTALMLSVGALGAWGMWAVHGELSNNTQVNASTLGNLNRIETTLLAIQRDDSQALIESNAVSREHDIALIQNNEQSLRVAIGTFMASSLGPSDQAEIDMLSTTIDRWLAYQHSFVADITLHSPEGDAAAHYLLTGPFQTQGQQFESQIEQLITAQRAKVNRSSALAFDIVVHFTNGILIVGALAVLGTLALGFGMTRSLTRMHREMAHINEQLEDSVVRVYQQNMQISNQHETLFQSHLALEEAIASVMRERDFQQALIDSVMPDIFLIIDARGILQQCNSAATQIFGWARSDIIGKPATRLFGSRKEAHQRIKSIWHATQTGKSAQFADTFTTQGGRTLQMEVNVAWNPALQVFIALARDITERVHIEERLTAAFHESERMGTHLHTIFESVHDGLYMVDAQGHELYRNRACDEILRLNPEESLTEHWKTLTLRTESGQLVAIDKMPMHRTLREGATEKQSIYLIHFPDGEHRVIQYEAVTIPAPNGDLSNVLGVIRDITRAYRDERHNEILRSLAHHCALATTEKEIAQTATSILMNGFDIPNCSIFVRRLDNPDHATALSMNLDQEISDEQHAKYLEYLEAAPIAANAPTYFLKVIATGEALFNQAPLIELAREFPFEQIAVLPLSYDGVTFGCLATSFTPHSDRRWEDPDQELLLTAADEIALALHRARLYAEAQMLAFRDPLTGLHNHRALQHQLQGALSTASVQTIPLSVIMLDVDHFRQFNETYGHDIGDQALKTVAISIQRAIRMHDIAARYGGEEFTVILPETNADDAHRIAERIRQEICAARIPVAGIEEGVPVTASLGVATYPTHASVATSLLKAADIALYASKHAGRNCVCRYSSHMVTDSDDMSKNDTPVVLPPTADLESVRTLLTAVDLRDGFTAAHSEGVSRYATAIATRMDLPPEQIEAVRIGGLIHDVGKISLPDHIVTKTGTLTDEEWQIMRQHTLMGEHCLAEIEHLRYLLPIVRSHHERLDGSGYPDGLRGDAIPLLVRIIAVADAFEAYTAERPYHPGRSISEGLFFLETETDSGRLDARVVSTLIEVLRAHPVDRERQPQAVADAA